jgi:ribose 5-phosphate isomerase A
MSELKKAVGYKAVDDFVKSGMVVGLGTGSTAYFAVERLGQLLSDKTLKDIICIPTSEKTRQQAESLDIPLTSLAEHGDLDVCIDGADAVDTSWALVKGGGGALLREKMVEVRAKKFVCIVDESKLCVRLGPIFPLPVEVTQFCAEHTRRVLAILPSVASILDRAELRRGTIGTPKRDGEDLAVTDNGNYIVDMYFKADIVDPALLAKEIGSTVGVVEHGLFIDMAATVLVAGERGVYEAPRTPAAAPPARTPSKSKTTTTIATTKKQVGKKTTSKKKPIK